MLIRKAIMVLPKTKPLGLPQVRPNSAHDLAPAGYVKWQQFNAFMQAP